MTLSPHRHQSGLVDNMETNSRATRVACFLIWTTLLSVGCQPPVQWGTYRITGQSLHWTKDKRSVVFEILGHSVNGEDKSFSAHGSRLVHLVVSPRFAGPFGLGHEGTHAGNKSADRLTFSGKTVEVALEITWRHDDNEIRLNDKVLPFVVGDTIRVHLGASGEIEVVHP